VTHFKSRLYHRGNEDLLNSHLARLQQGLGGADLPSQDSSRVNFGRGGGTDLPSQDSSRVNLVMAASDTTSQVLPLISYSK
jgi:hypothetical protein